MREKKDRPDHHVDMRSLTLTLSASLFIAMLAFFIVLNSFSSTSDAKIASLRGSLSASFGFVGGGVAERDTGDGGAGSASETQERAAEGLRSVLPDVGFASRKTAGGGRVMVVAVPRGELEERWPELRVRVGDVLNRAASGRHSLQIVALNGAAGTADLIPLARELAEEGVDEERIGIGYENRGQDAIELRFVITGAR